jgi:hypothetical protein
MRSPLYHEQEGDLLTYSGSRARIDEETIEEEHTEGRARAVVRAHFPEI